MEKIWRILFCAIISACSGQKPLDIPSVPPQEEQEQCIPVERLVFRLNGELYKSGGANLHDTVKLREEGLRTFEIVGYEPADAAPLIIETVNFYRDVYSFNYAGDSICVLGGSFALPRNHYVSPLGEGFAGFLGKKIPPVRHKGEQEREPEEDPEEELEDEPEEEPEEEPEDELPVVSFYNYVNRTYDETVIDRGNGPETVEWSSIGKYRLYRIEVAVTVPGMKGGQGRKSFFLPFYELENSVQIMNLQDGVIEIRPGDTIFLQKLVNAPEEFTQYEWVKGNATMRFNPLNGDAVERAYKDMMENPLLTEKGMQYTYSMIHLGRDGELTVESRWNPEDARANGGAVYTTIPVCVIMMPHGSRQSESFRREFLFPDNAVYEVFPMPFFCNTQVKIVY